MIGQKHGEHDDRCEFDASIGFYLCHCSKRRREARGLVKPPTEDLYYPPPYCPSCRQDLYFDGDCLHCDNCALSWASGGAGSTAHFTDDYGDLDALKARRVTA